jgi:hypothetical protein
MLDTSPVPNLQSAPHSVIALQLIRAYLKEEGYSRQNLLNLPEEKAHQIMGQAYRYSALKLAEIESRAKFKQKIRFEK